jgi:UDP-2,3-diacylglucosamine hydrolase
MKNNGDKQDSRKTGFSLFISDLHLCNSRQQITTAFLHFLENTASQAEALYILGDLFEFWAGDDDLEDPHHKKIASAFYALAKSGVKIYLMHGNRDFLISDDFCMAANVTLLNDPTIINLYGQKVLLSHGDDLCIDDTDYQLFRKQVREASWKKQFLGQSLRARKVQISAIRERSEHEKSQKSMLIMDVNQNAVAALLKAHDYPTLFIHGHTHRPDQHTIHLDGHDITRWVLGDWYEQGSYLKCNLAGCKAEYL